MSAAAWIKIYHDDLLQGCAAANLTDAERGVYMTVLMLMSARGGPIEYDVRWIAGQAGCRSPQAARKSLNRLIETGKLEHRDGLLANRRMIEEIEDRNKRSRQARSAVMTRWRDSDDAAPQLDLPDPDETKTGPKSRKKSGNKSAKKAGEKSQKKPDLLEQMLRNTGVSGDTDVHTGSGTTPARAESGLRTHNRSNERSGGSGDRELKVDDFMSAWQTVCNAAGYAPTSTAQIAASQDQVREWLDAGVSIQDTAIPVIQRTISRSDDPTGSLKRFDRGIRHEHAKRGASKPATYRKPETPILERDDEDPVFKRARAILHKELSEYVYTNWVNPLRFEIVPPEDRGPNTPATVKLVPVEKGNRGPLAIQQLMNGETFLIVQGVMAHVGFPRVV